ncbi:MAG: hypothetical protein K8953_06920, partial [Proteobacteria bacterium]|nr:hypothetical protein [Pseudomonadota bacterium]
DLANGESEAFSAISAGAGGALPVIVTFNDTLRDTVGLTEANLDIRIESNAGQVDRALGDLNTSLEQIGDALVFTFVPAFRSVAESISFATDNLETFFSIAALGAGALAARGIATGARIAGPANRLRVQRIERLPSSLTTPRDRVNFPPGARGTEEFQRSELNRVSDLARETQQINQYADAQVRATRTGGGLIASAAAGTIALDVFGDTVDATSVLLTTLPFAFVASSVLSLSKSVVTAIPGVNTLNSAFSNNTRALIASRDQAIALEGIYRGAGQSTRTFNERLGRISMRSINAGNDLSRFGRVVGRTGGVVQGTTRRIGNLTTAFGTAIGPAGRFGNAFRGTIPQIRRSSAALIALRAGISLIGGPIGLAIAGVGALGLAYALYGDRLTDVKGVNDEVTDSVKDLIIANEELYQGYAQASLRTRPIVEGQYRVAIATFDTTQEIYRQASANLTLLLSRDNLLRQQRDNPNAFGQGQQGDLASGIVLSAQALTVAEANLDRLGVLLGDATANRERLRRELDNGVFPEPGNGGLLLTGTGGIVNDLNLIQDETRELSDIFANNLTSAVDSAADAIGDFATDGVNSIQTLNEALSETVMGFGQGLISDSISNTFRQVGQSGLTGANGALQITAQGSALLGIPQGGASGPFSASSLAASQAQTQATLTQFFGSGFGSTGFGTALSSFAAVVGPAAGLFGATLVAGQLLERVIGRNRDVAIEGTAGGGSIDSVDVRQRRSGLSGFLLGRNNRRELSAGEDAVINQVFRPLFRTIDMIEETSGRAFSSVMFSGESATQAAADYANGVASQVGGVTRFNEAGESLIDTLDRLATGTEATNVAFNRAGFGDLIRGEFAQGLLDGIGGAGNIAATLGLRTDAQQRRLAEQEIARQQGVSGLGVGSTNQQLLNEISFLTLTIRQQSSVFQPGIDQAQSRLDFVTRNAAAFAPSELIRARNDLQRREDSLEGIIAPNLERLQTLTGLVDEFALVNTPSQRIQLGSSGFVNEAEQRLAESAQSNPETQRQEMIDIFRQILNDGTAGDRGIIDALGDARTADRLARGLTRS